MIKLIFLIKRRSDLTAEQFRDYYEKNHVELARKYFRDIIVDYRRNYVQSAMVNPVDNAAGGGDTAFGFDVVTEMVLKDETALEEMMRRFGDPSLQGLIAEDEGNFMERSALTMIRCDEVVAWSDL